LLSFDDKDDCKLNFDALVAVGVFAAVLLSIFGALYASAVKSHKRGEMGIEGVRLLRWALLGHVTLYAVLAVTAFLA
jgi:hypothetical protein